MAPFEKSAKACARPSLGVCAGSSSIASSSPFLPSSFVSSPSPCHRLPGPVKTADPTHDLVIPTVDATLHAPALRNRSLPAAFVVLPAHYISTSPVVGIVSVKGPLHGERSTPCKPQKPQGSTPLSPSASGTVVYHPSLPTLLSLASFGDLITYLSSEIGFSNVGQKSDRRITACLSALLEENRTRGTTDTACATPPPSDFSYPTIARSVRLPSQQRRQPGRVLTAFHRQHHSTGGRPLPLLQLLSQKQPAGIRLLRTSALTALLTAERLIPASSQAHRGVWDPIDSSLEIARAANGKETTESHFFCQLLILALHELFLVAWLRQTDQRRESLPSAPTALFSSHAENPTET
jgi:hypothetical protein